MTTNYCVFQEESYLRATYKLVSCEEHAFLIIVVNEDDLKHGVRVISFDKKKKAKFSGQQVLIKIRNKKYFFNPVSKKLTNVEKE